jgi:hypothetical protein
MTLALELATRVHAIRYEGLPSEAVRAAKVGILDLVGVTLAGCAEPTARIVAGSTAFEGDALNEKSARIYQYPVGILDRTWSLLQKSQGLLTELDLIQRVEDAYDGVVLNRDENFIAIRLRIYHVKQSILGIVGMENDVVQACA